jgi:hypothetical protein
MNLSIDYTQPAVLHTGPFDTCLGRPDWARCDGELWIVRRGIDEGYRFAPRTPENMTPHGPRLWYPVV